MVILVDDVLNSGKALAYGFGVFLNAPLKKLRTVVLVDRNHKNFPINTDYAGIALSTVLKQHVDVVLDTVGGETQERSFKVLRKGGILVSLVQPPSQESATKYGVRALFYGGHASSSDLAEIAKLIDDGKVKPVVETVLPLAETRRAHELSETGHARGKIVLKVA